MVVKLYEIKKSDWLVLTPIVIIWNRRGLYTFPARWGNEAEEGKEIFGTVNEGSTAAETDREAKTSTRDDQTGSGSPWVDDRTPNRVWMASWRQEA